MNARRRSAAYGLAFALLGVLIAAAAGLTACLGDGHRSPGASPTTAGGDLEGTFAGFAARLNAAQSYRDPNPDERELAMSALGNLVRRQRDVSAATAALGNLGFADTEDLDTATGRRYVRYTAAGRDGRAWGIVLVDLSAPTRLVIEVPHPNFDLRTERMGVQLFRRAPGSILLMAGAHRKAANGAADVAHNDRSLFNALATEAATRHLPQLQLHGFADESLPGVDAVVSTGNDTATPAAVRVADRLTATGFDTCQVWEHRCGRLEGTLNVQGQAAEQAGSVFVHLEVNWSTRRDDRLLSRVADTLAAADIAAG